jgi:hypothetical protein
MKTIEAKVYTTGIESHTVSIQTLMLKILSGYNCTKYMHVFSLPVSLQLSVVNLITINFKKEKF